MLCRAPSLLSSILLFLSLLCMKLEPGLLLPQTGGWAQSLLASEHFKELGQVTFCFVLPTVKATQCQFSWPITHFTPSVQTRMHKSKHATLQV